MSRNRNKSAKKDQFRQGKVKVQKSGNGWFSYQIFLGPDPLKFANSNELEKIKNRNKK